MDIGNLQSSLSYQLKQALCSKTNGRTSSQVFKQKMSSLRFDTLNYDDEFQNAAGSVYDDGNNVEKWQ